MRLGRTLLGSTLILAIAVPGIALAHSHPSTAAPRSSHKRAKTKTSLRSKGQRSIDDARAVQIQTSLIKSGYLAGQASGHWDSETEAAMQRFQSDNGWQTKLIPDSRAIIKLGLGPVQDSTPTTRSLSATSGAGAP